MDIDVQPSVILLTDQSFEWAPLAPVWVEPFKTTIEGKELTVSSVTSAFLAARCRGSEDARMIAEMLPEEASAQFKKVRQQLWTFYLPLVVHGILNDKFKQCPGSLECLLSTGNRHIHYHHDGLFWGDVISDPAPGNTYGESLMKIRSSYQKGDQNGHECPVTPQR